MSAHPLDPYLPLLEPGRPAVLARVAVLEVQDLSQLLALCREPRIARHLLARLSDTTALIEPGAEEQLVKALRSAGHTPRNVTGVES